MSNLRNGHFAVSNLVVLTHNELIRLVSRLFHIENNYSFNDWGVHHTIWASDNLMHYSNETFSNCFLKYRGEVGDCLFVGLV